MKTNRWVMRDGAAPDVVARLQKDLNDLPEALARSLVLRSVDTLDVARRYFRPSMAEDLHDPFLMQDMEAAADRVARAIRQKERVLVYGDYDVDGTTSTALMTGFLREMGIEADYFIPDRVEHGYGLNNAGIDHAKAQGASLILALDCGITAIEEAKYAKEQGIDLIICDHHKAGSTWPEAVAVLDPKRPDCAYPFKELSGCGVAFKLARATLMRLGEDPARALSYLDLVAVSTASDIVPLYGENRVLMREGFEQLQQGKRLGLRTLAASAKLDLDNVTVDRIVFTVGPRINAAGRMGDAGRAVALLLTDDPAEAGQLAQRLEAANQQRRTLDSKIRDEAFRQADMQITSKTRHALVLHNPNWHQGVIGIVASRVSEQYNRPAIILCTANGAAKGSARSIAGINIYDALTRCGDLLTQFGGHNYAAGMTLPEENISAFRDRFNDIVGEQMTAEMMLPSIEVDAEVDLAELDERFWAVLKQFAPFGPHNMRPIFHARGLHVVGKPRTVGDGSHLKLRVSKSQNSPTPCKPLDVIGFGLGDHLETVQTSQREGQPIELLFSVEENTWQGHTTLQLRARDLRLEEVG